MIISLVLVTVVLLACAVPQSPAPVVPPGRAGQGPVFMQIVAHQDDDILFMNPDVQNSLRTGAPSVTVYLTAGESDDPAPPAYIASRQAGVRAAYARMVAAADEWRPEPLAIAGVTVELYTLIARPKIQLIFVNLPESGNPKFAGGQGALTRMWRDNGIREHTLIPAGGVVHEPAELGRDGVVRLLVDLFARFRPTVLRTQDAQPDRRYAANWAPFHDHPDHVMAARFTGEAVRTYRARGANPRLILINYRDYNTEDAPVNLGEEQQREKLELFAVYGKHDHRVFYTGSYDAWPRRMYYRWPLGSTWAARDAGDRVQAFLVQAGELLTWWQEGNGTWAGPASLGDAGGMLAPSVSVARGGAGGRLQVFARRVDDDQIVTLTQSRAGQPQSWPAQWQSLGNPNQHEGAGAKAELGVPLAVAGPDGKVVVFVRNASGGVSSRTEETPGGAWQRDWVKLDGADVQDGLAAVSHSLGIDLFASTRTRVLSWRPGPDGPFTSTETFPFPPPAGPPMVCGTALWVMSKRPGTAEVSLGGAAIPGATGPGGLAASCAGSGNSPPGTDPLVFARNPAGTVIMHNARQGGWVELAGADLVDQPVAITDAAGRILLLGESTDGRLVVNEQRDGDPVRFTGWRPVGS